MWPHPSPSPFPSWSVSLQVPGQVLQGDYWEEAQESTVPRAQVCTWPSHVDGKAP